MTTTTTPNNPKALSDRQTKLRNYHARKIVEKQQLQESQQQSHGMAAHHHQQSTQQKQSQQGTSAQHQQQPPSSSSSAPSSSSSRPTTSRQSEPIIQLSHSQKMRQRSLLKNNSPTKHPPNVGETTLTAAAPMPMPMPMPMPATAKSLKGTGTGGGSNNRGYGYGSPPPSSAAPPIHHRRNHSHSSTTSSHSAGGLERCVGERGDGDGRAGSSRANNGRSSIASIATVSAMATTSRGGKADSRAGRASIAVPQQTVGKSLASKGMMTTAQKAAFMASQRRSSSVNSTNNSSAGKSKKSSSSTVSSSATPVISNKSSSGAANNDKENSKGVVTGANKSSGGKGAAASMKRLFAARRRKAQMEMQSSIVLNTSMNSTTSMNSNASSEDFGNVNGDGKSLERESVGSTASVATVNTVNTMGTVNTAGTSSGTLGSSKSAKSSYSSRRALDRYLGRSSSRGNSSSIGGGGSSSVASSSSSSGSTLGNSTLSSATSSGLSSGLNNSGGGNNIGMSCSSGGISLSSSMDSMDNHTIASLPSRSGGAGAGRTLPPVKEESCHSLSMMSSPVPGKNDVGRGGAVENGIASQGHQNERGGEHVDGEVVSSAQAKGNAASITSAQNDAPPATTSQGILRDRSYSKEDLSTATSSSFAEEAEKSVRFHLSPLEKLQREKERRKREEEADRGREEGEDGDNKDRAQCSPPREHSYDDESNSDRRGGGGRRDNVERKEASIHRKGMEEDAKRKDASKVSGDEQVEMEEDMEFTMFVAGLRREVAGDHTELWSGFQSLLGRPPSHQVPLHESYIDEAQLVESDRNGKKKKKKKPKVKMDPQTQTSLKTIHTCLMSNDKIKGRFMTSSCQLMNDKKVRKDREAEGGQQQQQRLGMSKGSMSRRHAKSEDGASRSERLGEYREERDRNASRGRERQREDDALSNSAGANNEGARSKQHHRSSRQGNSTSSSPIKNGSDKSLGGFSNVKLRSVHRSNSNTSKDSRSVASIDTSASAKKERLSWMEALKKKQKSLRLKQLADVDNNSQGGGSSVGSSGGGNGMLSQVVLSPVNRRTSGRNSDEGSNNGAAAAAAAIMLRKVGSPRKKARITPPSTPKEEQAAPWANVQLRSTPKKRESMQPTLQPTTASSSSAPSSRPATLQPAIQPNGSWNSSSSGSSGRTFVLSPVNHTPKNFNEGSTTPSLPPLCCVGDVIDLDALPKKLFPIEEGKAAMFPLKRSVKEPDVKKIVIVGRAAVVTATTPNTASTSSGPKKATVTFWCRRSEIRALTLNVEATGANLAHTHGRTPLLFESSDVCLDFAQAFYRGVASLSSSSAGGSGAGSSSEAVASSSAVHAAGNNLRLTSANGDPPSKNLTEDEESLLENYRQFSHSDRTKLRLTCLSPRGEMEEVEVSLTPTAAPMSAASAISNMLKSKQQGTDVDEKAASKFRKMLKMGIPPDAVKHKMIMEKVDESTISAVLDGGEQKASSDKKDSSDGLSEEEEKLASKYRKMLKMGIPPDAVKHKMTSDGILQPKIVNAVLGAAGDKAAPKEGSGSSNNNKVQLSEEEEKVATKYRKMMKMGVPEDGVRHKMAMEGVADKIVDAVFGKPSAQEEKGKTGTAQPQLSEKEEVIASKYRKMLKMGVPLDGVKHKMKQDSVDLKIISVLVGEVSPANEGGGASAKPSASKKSSKPAGPPLSKEEEAIASKYRNMLKVCIPKDAVRHKMKQEGVSNKIVEAVLGKEADGGSEGPAAAGSHQPGSKANTRKTIAFHWTTSDLAPELLEQSIFGRTELKKRKLASINPEESDIKKLEELFQKRNNSKTAKMKAGTQEGETSNEMAKLLDLTRANNIAISLKAFNDFTFRSLAETINDLDPDCKIVGERVQFIPNLLPTPKEIQAIKKYKGDDDKLITAELFFRQLVSIKRIEDKVRVMKTMVTFEEHLEEARAGFKTLQEVCSQVMNSEKLIQILEMVLNVGNLMNAGTLNGGVDAFKFESLPKLSQTKSADGKTTVLDYIVETFIEKGERQALMIMTEFPDIQDSCRLSIGDLIGDMNTLKNDYKLCKTELASMKRDQSSKRVTRSMSKQIKDESNGSDDPRKALFAAIQSRGMKKDEKQSPADGGDPRQALFAAIKNKKKDESADAEGATSTSSPYVKHSAGVHRLQKFLSHSKTILSLAERDQDAAVRACKGLAVYCGEDGGERSAAPLLQVLSGFAQSLENGVKKYDTRVAAEKKRLAAQKKKEKGKENGKQNVQSSSPKKLLRASSLQPHVGVTDRVKRRNAISGQEKKDSMNAVLNAIKNKGSQKSPLKPANNRLQTNNSPVRSQNNDPKQALLSSIKNRRESLPSKPPPDSVPDRVKHINNNVGRKESRVLLVNRMLAEAPASVKQDFLQGVTYKETDDPLLLKIYEKEDGDEKVEAKTVDPRKELLAAIRSRS